MCPSPQIVLIWWFKCITDSESLQHDLDALQKWSEKWLLAFHPEKCKVLRLGNRDKDSIAYCYKMGDAELMETTCEKDLGVQIDNKLSFSDHINEKVNKANSLMGVVRRAFRHLDIKTFNSLYKGIVRPHLEYAVPIWNPHLKKDIKKIERVQRRATKQVPDLKNMSYKDRLTKLKLPTLVYRRMRGDMIEVYKILTGKYDPQVSDFLPLHSNTTTNNRTRGHPLKLAKQKYTLDVCKYSFSRRVETMWNKLPMLS